MTSANSLNTHADPVCMFVFNNCKNDTRVLKESATLAAAGHAVTVLATFDDTVAAAETVDGVSLRRLKAENALTRWLTDPRHGRRLRAFGNRLSRVIRYLNYCGNCLRFTHRRKFGIYHAHDLPTLWLAVASRGLRDAKIVYDSHELYSDRNIRGGQSALIRRVTILFERILIRRADAVITVSQMIAYTLQARYAIATPLVIMNIPVSRPRAEHPPSLRELLPIAPNRKIILYSGGFTFNRGLEPLFEAISRLPDTHLVLMGYGNPEFIQELKSLAEHLRIADRLSFFGPVPSSEVSLYAASADVGVAPIENVCLSHYYCAPNKIFEYIMAGLPVAVSEWPEIRRLVRQYDIGETFNPENPDNIASALAHMLSDPRRMDKMKENAAKAAEIFNWEQESAKLIACYRSLNPVSRRSR